MKKSLLLFFILVVALQKSFAQTTPFIYTDTVTPIINLAYTEAENDIYINSDETIFPVSRTITVPFRTIGTFNPGNVFNIVLSDTSGNFNTPSSRIIGTLSASGIVGNRSVDVVIPYSQLNSSNDNIQFDTIPSSFEYRVRVESTDPVVIGTLNAASITLETAKIMIGSFTEQDESMEPQDMAKVIDWLQKTLTSKETPFCWKKSATRAQASAPNAFPRNCKSGYYQSGELCYFSCNSGYFNVAGVCWENCPNGWVDGGIFCYPQVGTVHSPSALGDCPAEYDNTGIECYRWVKSVYYPSSLASCPSGYTNMGFTCYKPWSVPVDDFPLSDSRATCPSGYFKGFANRCYYNCGPGWTNDGDFCRRPDDHISYANGMYCPAGYDPTPTYAFGRCYQKCGEGWYSTGEFCQISQATKDKTSYVQPIARWVNCKTGYTPADNNPLNLVNSLIGRCTLETNPSTFVCNNGFDTDAGLCYPKCPSGMYGVGPVCYQSCGPMVECGAGCATSQQVCQETITEQVVSTVMLIKSIATTVLGPFTGGASVAANKTLNLAVNGVQKTATLGTRATKATRAMFNMAKAANQLKKTTTISYKLRNLKYVKKGVLLLKDAKLAYESAKPIIKRIKIMKKRLEYAYDAVDNFNSVCENSHNSYLLANRDGVITDLGPEIDNQLKSRFNTIAYNQILDMWATIKFDKFAANLGFDIADKVLTGISVIGLADPTGIVSGVADVVNAYTKPICDIAPNFPTLSKNYK
jgi:hypothetical protein